jgi:hypothetical protein
MIENDDQLNFTLEQMGRMYRVLADLRREVLPKSRQWFNLMAQGPVEEIRKMQAEIDAYTGMNEVSFDDEDAPESGAEAHAGAGSIGSCAHHSDHGDRLGKKHHGSGAPE